MCVFKYHAFIYFLRPPPWYGTVKDSLARFSTSGFFIAWQMPSGPWFLCKFIIKRYVEFAELLWIKVQFFISCNCQEGRMYCICPGIQSQDFFERYEPHEAAASSQGYHDDWLMIHEEDHDAQSLIPSRSPVSRLNSRKKFSESSWAPHEKPLGVRFPAGGHWAKFPWVELLIKQIPDFYN